MLRWAVFKARLDQLERPQADALLHKFKGAAASMALTELAAVAAELEQLQRAAQDTGDGRARLQAAMDTVLQTIAWFAPEEDAPTVRHPL